MVVERGLARCPRCVTMADYVFIESETKAMRYEVSCPKCGECYGENSMPWSPPAAIRREPPMQWPPDCEPAPRRDWRTEVRERMSVSARRGRAGIEILGMHTRMMIERARTQLRERGTGDREDQTGG